MRRSTASAIRIAVLQQGLLRSLRTMDRETVDVIAATLGEFSTDERKERLRRVIDARLDSVTVVMDAPHDPHNGAAVLRSCDAFGVQRLHVIERREAFLSSATVSRGSERWVDVRTYRQSAEAAEALARGGHTLVATHPEGELLPEDLRDLPKVALVLGNEREGIHAELESHCTRRVRVPMRGFAESLNVSVTAAILLEHATRDRPGDLHEDERARLYARALALSVTRAKEILEAKGLRLE